VQSKRDSKGKKTGRKREIGRKKLSKGQYKKKPNAATRVAVRRRTNIAGTKTRQGFCDENGFLDEEKESGKLLGGKRKRTKP